MSKVKKFAEAMNRYLAGIYREALSDLEKNAAMNKLYKRIADGEIEVPRIEDDNDN